MSSENFYILDTDKVLSPFKDLSFWLRKNEINRALESCWNIEVSLPFEDDMAKCIKYRKDVIHDKTNNLDKFRVNLQKFF